MKDCEILYHFQHKSFILISPEVLGSWETDLCWNQDFILPLPLSLPTPLNWKQKSRAFLCYLCAVVHKSIQAKTKTADLNCRLVDVLSHFLLLPCLPRGSFCLQHPADLTALRHWCWEPWHLLQRMLPHCSHACYNHTGRDCLCLQFPSPKPFTFRAFSISWNLFWFGPWLFPPLFFWCFMFFLLTYRQVCTNQ